MLGTSISKNLPTLIEKSDDITPGVPTLIMDKNARTRWFTLTFHKIGYKMSYETGAVAKWQPRET